jgi:hypothetical protein
MLVSCSRMTPMDCGQRHDTSWIHKHDPPMLSGHSSRTLKGLLSRRQSATVLRLRVVASTALYPGCLPTNLHGGQVVPSTVSLKCIIIHPLGFDSRPRADQRSKLSGPIKAKSNTRSTDPAVTRSDNVWDNAAIESLFSKMKTGRPNHCLIPFLSLYLSVKRRTLCRRAAGNIIFTGPCGPFPLW